MERRHICVFMYLWMVVVVVDTLDLLMGLRFLGIVFRLSVLTVVIISIRVNLQPPKQPAHSEFHMVLVDELVSL